MGKTALIVAGTAVVTVVVSKLLDRWFAGGASHGAAASAAPAVAGAAAVPADVKKAIEDEVVRQYVSRAALERRMPRAGKTYPAVPTAKDPRRVLVTGGAGFVGSNLVDALMMQGHTVYVLDNLYTGHRKNIEHWLGHPNFSFFQEDVVHPFFVEVDRIYHLACPASPPHYMRNSIKTIKCSTMGTLNMLGLAKRVKARLLLTSTSEIYGDPEIHPQPESYWGHVNPIGPRACYDEGKRVAETMCYAYKNVGHVEVRVARIFNTYGPRMDPKDGRVVSNFIIQALRGEALTIYGDGSQTRSFQYVEDLVRGLMALMESDNDQPTNIGNPVEYTIAQFANIITKRVNPGLAVKKLPPTEDDPKQRRPLIRRAMTELGWYPRVPLEEGLTRTIEYFREEIGLPRSGRVEDVADEDVSPIWITTPLDIPSKTRPLPGLDTASDGSDESLARYREATAAAEAAAAASPAAAGGGGGGAGGEGSK